MALWPVSKDLRRVFRGACAFFKFLASKDPITMGLGLLSAESYIARRGLSNRYVVRIASAYDKTQHAKLVIDIYSMTVPKHPEGHYAYFTQSLSLPPRTASVVEIQYDWLHAAYFHIDGVSSPAAELWRGSVDAPQLYSIFALLFDPQGSLLDRLAIFQELVG
jgi:hypothetical protein